MRRRGPIYYRVPLTGNTIVSDIGANSEEQNHSENLLQYAGVGGHYGEGVKIEVAYKTQYVPIDG